MTTPYLIQRLKFKNLKIENPSFDQLLQCDYMGSAEFEFNALPKSLKKLTRTYPNLVIYLHPDIVNETEQRLCLIGLEKSIQEYKQYLEKLFTRGIRLKEPMMVDSKLNEEGNKIIVSKLTYVDVDAWWDICNDIIMCFGKPNTKKILKCIEQTRNNKMKNNDKDWY